MPEDDTAIPGPTIIDEGIPAPESVAELRTREEYQIPASYWTALQDAKKLPKPMYSWPVDLGVLRNEQNREPLKHWARITWSLGIGDYYTGYTKRDWEIARDIARAAGVGLTFNTSPFHRAGTPNRDPNDWSDTGNELGKTAEYLQDIKSLELPINCIALDSECYKEPHEDVTRRLDHVYDLAKLFFSETPVYWYRNGDWAPVLDVASDYIRCSKMRSIRQYQTYDRRYTELWLNYWEKKLNEPEWNIHHPNTAQHIWSVWTTLGPGYEDGWKWKLNLDPLHYEYLGRMHMGDNRIRAVLLYPNTFRPCTMPESLDAFLAYVRGARE